MSHQRIPSPSAFRSLSNDSEEERRKAVEEERVRGQEMMSRFKLDTGNNIGTLNQELQIERRKHNVTESGGGAAAKKPTKPILAKSYNALTAIPSSVVTSAIPSKNNRRTRRLTRKALLKWQKEAKANAQENNSSENENRSHFQDMQGAHHMTSIRMKHIKGALGFEFPRFMVDETRLKFIKHLSYPNDSASGSFVLLFNSIEGLNNYVLKVTGQRPEMVIEPNKPNLNLCELETRIYRIMNRLVRNLVTPHVFQIVDSLTNQFRIDLHPNGYFRSRIRDILKCNYFSALLNETSSGSDQLIKLYEFMLSPKFNGYTPEQKEKILFNIIFQVLYTLEAFNRVGVKHNDLHLGNIFILVRDTNLTEVGYEPKVREYSFKHSTKGTIKVRLEDIGFDVRIYDFDRSCKFNRPNTIFPEEFHSRVMEDLGYDKINQNHTQDNPYFDTYKFLASIYELGILTPKVDEFIIKCFKSYRLLLEGKGENITKNTVDFLSSVRYQKLMQLPYHAQHVANAERLRGFFLINDLPIDFMQSTEDILAGDLVFPSDLEPADQFFPDDIQNLCSLVEYSEDEADICGSYDMDYINFGMKPTILKMRSKTQTARNMFRKSKRLPKSPRRKSLGNATPPVKKSAKKRRASFSGRTTKPKPAKPKPKKRTLKMSKSAGNVPKSNPLGRGNINV